MAEGEWSFGALAALLDALPPDAVVALAGSPAAIARLRCTGAGAATGLWRETARMASTRCVANRIDPDAFPALRLADVECTNGSSVIVAPRATLRFAAFGPLAELAMSQSDSTRWSPQVSFDDWLAGSRRIDALVLAGVRDAADLLGGARWLIECHAPMIAIDVRQGPVGPKVSATLAASGYCPAIARGAAQSGDFALMAPAGHAVAPFTDADGYTLPAARIGWTGNLDPVPDGTALRWSRRSPGLSVVIDCPEAATCIELTWSGPPRAPARVIVDGCEVACTVEEYRLIVPLPPGDSAERVVSVCPIRTSTTERLQWPDLRSIRVW